MSALKAVVLFVLKSFVFSVVFICTAFILYALSPLNTQRHKVADGTEAKYLQEYSRQLSESSKTLEVQKDILRRAEANMTEMEKNSKRMSAILDIWERQANRGK